MTAYKESGIKWLGKIPAHWEVSRVKHTFKERIELGFENETLLVSSQKMGVVPKNIYGNKTVEATKNLHLLKLVKVGDFVISLRSFQGGIEYAYYQGIISPAYTILEISSKKLLKDYFKHLAKSQSFIGLLQSYKTGIREGQNINYAELKEDYIPLPPLEEQRKIADFLDKKLEKIDYFIAKQTKFIELLKEQKQVLINQATTKGLDKSTELKDTHISHLGKIPTHWEVVRLKNIAKFNRGLNITKENLKDDGVYCISYGEIHSKYPFIVNPKNHKLKCVENEYLNTNINSMLYKGDFIFADTSEDIEGSGNFTLYDGEDEAFAGYHTIIVRVDKNIFYPKFLAYEFDSKTYRNKIQSLVSGVKVFSITQAILRETEVWIPPLEEQKKIAKYLDDKCEKIDKAINNITKQISLIQEYKTSLIDTTTKGMLKELK